MNYRAGGLLSALLVLSAAQSAYPAQGSFQLTFAETDEQPTEFLGPLSDHLFANLRAYDYRQDQADNTENAASVVGGSLGYKTGLWRGRIGGAATAYTSQRIWGPSDRGGTGLLKSNQQSFSVLGELYADLRAGSFSARGGRQVLQMPYINKEDIRQIPITHEAYLARYRGETWDLLAGHVSDIKLRDDDAFRSMAEAAGVLDEDKGVSVAAVQVDLPGALTFGITTQHGWDVFNTTYGDLYWEHAIAEGVNLELGAQFSDQRSVGDELLGNYDAQAWGVRGRLSSPRQTLSLSFSDYSDDARIERPFGESPGFNVMIVEKFDNPGEQSIGLRYATSLDALQLGDWSASLAFVSGWNIVDPATGASEPDEMEWDLGIDYRPQRGVLKGLSLALKYLYVDFGSGAGSQWNTRVVINYRLTPRPDR